MKNIDEVTDEELTNLMFDNLSKNSAIEKEKKNNLKIDLTYKDYPVLNIITGEFHGYPFEGWTKKEIEEYLKENKIEFNSLLIKDNN